MDLKHIKINAKTNVLGTAEDVKYALSNNVLSFENKEVLELV